VKSPVGWLLLSAVPLVIGTVAAIVLRLAYPDVLVRFITTPAGLALGVGAAITGIAVIWVVAARRSAQRRYALLVSGAEQARIEHQEFLARLDHELKNPLTAIRAALAAHGTEGSPHLEIADSQAQRLGSLVGDLRKLSGLQSQELECEPVDLGEVVGEATEAVNTSLRQRGSSREFTVDFPTVPWRVPPIEGDSDLLYLAVFNLLANAAKFTGEGDCVEVRAGEVHGRVWLEVADTGIGIPAEDLPHVWSELARGSNARGISGSGLGLPLVKVVIERHGGRVSVRSREGEGTAVRIELPVKHPTLELHGAGVPR